MISRVFIERPIFAWVLAIVVMLAGAFAMKSLPISQYPNVAPPNVSIRANYPGASAETIENSVTQVIEQTLTGIDGMLYFSSTSTSRGQVTISATFDTSVNPDIAQVQVQNQVQQAIPRLPQQVQQQGIVVRKANPDDLMLVAIYDENNTVTNRDIADYLTTNFQDPISRIAGIGDANVYGSPYAMRIWLDPDKLASFQLMPGDVLSAIRSQNAEVAAGQVGDQPQPATQMLNALVTAQTRLQTPEQFRQIVLKTQTNGASVRLQDVARVELGSENYNSSALLNGHPAAGMALQLAPGANALESAELVRDEVSRLSANLPSGWKVAYLNDATDFIRLSIDEVAKTLFEAIVLVVIVMFVFLQSWRATLVPAIAVPVVLLGTLAIVYAADFSINTLTLFGLVLAIGLLVDDAIVVVENVERLMHENPRMTPREATIASMREINIALIAIALVLSAVFLPMVMFGGSTGVIYRQFSLTIVSSMALSVLVALVLSPALTATLLKSPHAEAAAGPGWIARRAPGLAALPRRAGGWFNRLLERSTERYLQSVQAIFRHKFIALAVYAAITAALVLLFLRLPTGFLPSEDQGRVNVQFRLPGGATLGRTSQVRDQVNQYLNQYESSLISSAFIVAGGGGPTASQNSGQGFVSLIDWSQREGDDGSADALIARLSKALSGLRDASVFVLAPPPIRGFGQTSGFTMELQNTSGMPRAEFDAARDRLLAAAQRDPLLGSVRPTLLPDTPTLRVNSDPQVLSTLGLSQDDVNATLSTAWGGSYVNDFVDRGRVKRVYVQGDAPFRASPDSIYQWHVRGANGQMTPFSAFAATSWAQAPTALLRFNGVPATELQGTPAPGVSSGTAMARMEELARAIPGVSVAWAGLSFQERLSTGQAPLLYALSLLLVFLCLAALYESWSIPIAVLLVVPLGLIGAVVAVTLRGLENDVYFQIGLITTMGLAAKNAILIVEFAEQAEKRGMGTLEAALEAARLRLRPILMTSFAFIFGALPLALSTGGGANSRIEIGTAVVGGTFTATILAIFYIPLFYVLVRMAAQRLSRLRHGGHGQAQAT
ncbi:multidrug efflux RND transporter permease subunit [Luteimonas aquatica]|uniref:multidrug efflux RND transporter permease subunit n=1 Tax=Luteimonas aquatica TaxID=450364 RepID=UPI001F58DC50|nr:multidrug efflux RND transporter permease subunit [Luteimonas aquatica]